MVDPGKTVVVVLRLQRIGVLGLEADVCLCLIDEGKVVSEIGREYRRLSPPNTLIVKKEERLVLGDRATQRSSKLILPQPKRRRARLQERTRVDCAVLKILVDRTMKIVGAGLGDNVHDAPE